MSIHRNTPAIQRQYTVVRIDMVRKVPTVEPSTSPNLPKHPLENLDTSATISDFDFHRPRLGQIAAVPFALGHVEFDDLVLEIVETRRIGVDPLVIVHACSIERSGRGRRRCQMGGGCSWSKSFVNRGKSFLLLLLHGMEGRVRM